MSFPFHTVKRLAIFMMLGIIPVGTFVLFLLLGMDLIISSITSFFIAAILVVIAMKFTDSPFLRMSEGRAFGVLSIASPGKIDWFDVKLEGNYLIGKIMGHTVKHPFSTKLFFRISSILNNGKFINEDNKEKFIIELERAKFNNAMFKTDYPILIWNEKLQSFITKEWLSEQENSEMLLLQGIKIKAHLEQFNNSVIGIAKYIIDLIGKNLAGGAGWIFWIIVIIVGAVLIWLAWPSLQGALGSAAGGVGGASIPNILPEKFG